MNKTSQDIANEFQSKYTFWTRTLTVLMITLTIQILFYGIYDFGPEYIWTIIPTISGLILSFWHMYVYAPIEVNNNDQ